MEANTVPASACFRCLHPREQHWDDGAAHKCKVEGCGCVRFLFPPLSSVDLREGFEGKKGPSEKPGP